MSILFSIRRVIGIIRVIREKYRTDATCPIIIKGFSTGCPPTHVRVNRSATKIQNRNWLRGRNIMVCCLVEYRDGIIARIRIDRNRAITPPSLLGMDRRMA